MGGERGRKCESKGKRKGERNGKRKREENRKERGNDTKGKYVTGERMLKIGENKIK